MGSKRDNLGKSVIETIYEKLRILYKCDIDGKWAALDYVCDEHEFREGTE